MIKQDDMENMTNKTLRQIQTNIVPQNNVPNVPQHLQTASNPPPDANDLSPEANTTVMVPNSDIAVTAEPSQQTEEIGSLGKRLDKLEFLNSQLQNRVLFGNKGEREWEQLG